MARLLLLTLSLFFLQSNAWQPAETIIIRGKITDKTTLLPLEGVEVEILNFSPYKMAKTNEEGRFRLADVPLGRYKLLYKKKGYKSIIKGIEITSAAAMEFFYEKMEEDKELAPASPAPNKLFHNNKIQ